MDNWPQDAVEAIYTLSRGLHDIRPHDRAVSDLMTEAEYELHARKADPAQTDFRATLALRGLHERTLNGAGVS